MSVGLPDEGKEDRLMKPDSSSAIPLEMEQARQELEGWRSTHRPRCHIPDSLWKRAAELASQHGLYLTSRTLRVDYMRLKKLVQPTSPERKSAALPRFIELMAPTVAGIPECVNRVPVDMEDCSHSPSKQYYSESQNTVNAYQADG
jgi:hypothetical protein